MKSIILPNIEATAHAVLRNVLEQPPEGANLDEQRKRIRVLDRLEEINGSDLLILEDADYEVLKRVYQTYRFRVVHRDIIKLAEAIDGAQTMEVPKPGVPD